VFSYFGGVTTLADAIAGAVVGSFLNVLIYRVPRRLSIVSPGSACPSCGTAIRWFDNVPLVSWLWLRGRCRQCSSRISIRYPLVELTAAVIGVATVLRYGLSVAGVEAVLFAWVSLALALIDLEHQILPDVMTYPSIVFGLVFSYFGGVTTLADAIAGAVVGGVIPILVIVIYKLWRGIEGMGWGDVKYLAAIGAVVGLSGCLWVLVIAAVLGALVGIGLIVTGRGSGRTALPFGTFLALAVIVWLYLPPSWTAWIAP
jgi:leader peptidase (prepilin peptidase)/N-methyltransferase